MTPKAWRNGTVGRVNVTTLVLVDVQTTDDIPGEVRGQKLDHDDAADDGDGGDRDEG